MRRKIGIRMAAVAVALGMAALCLAQTGTGPTPPGPTTDGTLPALTTIAGEAMMRSQASPDLEYLSDYIGARLTGSPQAAEAVTWAESRMRKMGLVNVHAERYTIWRGWKRISASAEIVAPVHKSLMVDSMGWVGSTPARGVTAEVVPVNLYQIDDEIKYNAPAWTGKILIMVAKGPRPANGAQLFIEYGKFLQKAWAEHAVAVIGGQGGAAAAGMHLTHTGILGYAKYYRIPVVSMAVEGQDEIERLLGQGKTVRVKIDVQNRTTKGPVGAANAVGEIVGTRFPSQIVVVGAHLDAWDLSQGTTDNGFGSVCALEAARAILESRYRPLRTIRFVLFTGEEQGLLGSFAYVKQHKARMDDHVAMLTMDNGQGPIVSLEVGGHANLIPAVEQFTKSLAAFGKIRVDDRAVFDTDTGPFILGGIPGINMGQNSPEYRYTHHSNVDSFDKVKTETLDQDATVMALTAFWIADRPERLGHTWPPERTARMLVKQHQDVLLKAFGLWPFGSMGEPAR